MIQVRRRYTTVQDGKDYLVTLSYSEESLETRHWFETQVSVQEEISGTPVKLPRELATYRVGETERPYRELIQIDFDGDREAALSHLLGTICRRVYAYIERGH